MPRTALFSRIAILAVGFATGCFPTEPEVEEPIPDALAELRAARCDAIARCQPDFYTADDVALALAGRCELYGAGVDPERALLAREDVFFDEVDRQRCIRDLRDCRLTSTACDRVFTGEKPLGAGCMDDEECVSGACSGSTYYGECGECVVHLGGPRPALGESCFATPCAEVPNAEAACWYDEGDLEATCRLVRELPEGASCDAPDTLCARGFFCQADLLCGAARAVGGPCVVGDICTFGSFCSADARGPGICIPIVLGDLHDLCSESLPTDGTYHSCDAARDLRCDPERLRCTRIRRRGRDEPCGGFDDCALGLRCEEGRCSDLLANGALCRWNGDCESGFCSPDAVTERHCREFPATCD